MRVTGEFFMKTDYQLSIINRLRDIRQERNLSQAQMAISLGISTGQMGNIETPKASHKYTIGQIYTICNEFNISVADIFLSDEERKLPTNDQINILIKNIVQYEQ